MLPTQNHPVFRFRVDSALLGPRALRHEPVGADQLSVSLHRDPKTHGVGVEYSSSLSFVKAGKAYVQRAYEAAGIEADVQVTAEQYDPNAFAWLPYYQGRVDYVSAEFTATTAKVNLEQASFWQKFLARNSVQVNLFADTSVSGAAGPTAVPQVVSLHSRALLQRYAASQQEKATVSATMQGDNGDPSHEQVLYFGFDTPELNELNLGAVNGGFVAGDSVTAAPIYTAKENGPFVIDLALYAHVEAHTSPGSFMRQFTKVGSSCFLRVDGANGATTLLQPEIAVGHLDGDYEGEIAVAPHQFTYDLRVGDSIYLYATWYVHDLTKNSPDPYQATITATMQPGSYLRITATTQTAPTPTTGLLLYESLDRLTQALTDEVDVFRSDFFGRPDCVVPYPIDGPGALTLLTGGFQVRGFPILAGPPATATPTAITLDVSYSARIRSGSIYELSEGSAYDAESVHQQLYFGFNELLGDTLGLPAVKGGYVSGKEQDVVPVLVIKDPGNYTFELALSALVKAIDDGAGSFREVFLSVHFRINNGPDNLLYSAHEDGLSGDWQRLVDVPAFTLIQSLLRGDKVYLYGFLYFADARGSSYQFKAQATMNSGSYFRVSAHVQRTVTDSTDLRKSLTTSWQEAYDSLSAAYNLGYGTEWGLNRRGKRALLVRVEHFSYFYPVDVVVDLTAAGPLAVTTRVVSEAHYQVGDFGYAQWQANTAGGLDEFNATRQWTTPLTVVSNTYAQTSKFAASGVLLEATRRDRYDATATTDTSTDSTNFLVCLLRTGGLPAFETERNQRAVQLAGVLSPDSVYNLRLSPGRLLRRHWPVFGAGVKPTRTSAVRYTAGTGNTTMVSQLADEPSAVAESGDVATAALPAPLWLPLEYELKGVPFGRAQLAALLARPTGRVRFLHEDGRTLEGWVLDFKHTATDEVADFTLLACAS